MAEVTEPLSPPNINVEPKEPLEHPYMISSEMHDTAVQPDPVEMNKRYAQLWAEYNDLKAGKDDLSEAHATLVEEHDAVKVALSAYENIVAGLHAEIEALKAKIPPAPHVYEYAEGECHPVALNSSCPKCGWVRGVSTEPHPIA